MNTTKAPQTPQVVVSTLLEIPGALPVLRPEVFCNDFVSTLLEILATRGFPTAPQRWFLRFVSTLLEILDHYHLDVLADLEVYVSFNPS